MFACGFSWRKGPIIWDGGWWKYPYLDIEGGLLDFPENYFPWVVFPLGTVASKRETVVYL